MHETTFLHFYLGNVTLINSCNLLMDGCYPVIGTTQNRTAGSWNSGQCQCQLIDIMTVLPNVTVSDCVVRDCITRLRENETDTGPTETRLWLRLRLRRSSSLMIWRRLSRPRWDFYNFYLLPVSNLAMNQDKNVTRMNMSFLKTQNLNGFLYPFLPEQ